MFKGENSKVKSEIYYFLHQTIQFLLIYFLPPTEVQWNQALFNVWNY